MESINTSIQTKDPNMVKFVKKSIDVACTLSAFLNKHYVKKEDTDVVITNTRIGDRNSNLPGGKYHIPDDKYADFLKIYYNDVFRKGDVEHLTEKQLDSIGPILIDLDLKFSYDTKKRLFTKEHIFDLICVYLEELREMYQFDENEEIPIFVFEKDTVNRVADKQITKDGIHMIIGMQVPHAAQCILRTRILARIADTWNDLPIKNEWDDVFDIGISKGTTNWQLYGSRKPHHDAYKLKYVYNLKKNVSDDEVAISEVSNVKIFETEENIFKLSARYPSHPALFMTSKFVIEYNGYMSNEGTNVKHRNSSAFVSEPSMLGNTLSIGDILRVTTKEELESVKLKFIASIPVTSTVIHESYQYTMSLPKSYYSVGSFSRWLRVGWALRNTSDDLFVVWVIFSEQSPDFKYSSIRDDLYTRWLTFDINNPNGKTVRSLMHWSKQDAPTKYDLIRKDSINFYIEETLDKLTHKNITFSSKARGKGCGDYDLATVLHQMYKDEYVCVSIKNNIWYRYENHKWFDCDSGTSLRRELSVSMSELYRKKVLELNTKMSILFASVEGGSTEDNLKSPEMIRINNILDIVRRLGQTSDKNNIMNEAKSCFFDRGFVQKLDMNPYLLCFNNGVFDFSENVFRDGRPEDCITKCTNSNYRKIDYINDKTTMLEVNDFMEKLFPNKDLLKYMWEHLASILIGTVTEQTLNMYIGGGQNGKSVLVNLMEKCLGDYKGEVPLTLITQQRTKVGAASPEIVQLRGIRYAVIQEPSKGDKINEGMMKQLTGGDPIQGRGLYLPQVISFIPQFKLILCSNIFMDIGSNDHGTWRRIRVADFESKFVDNPVTDDPDSPFQFPLDRYIKDKFDRWQPVFMGMLIDIVCRTKGAVSDCSKVLTSSNSYRNGQDYFAEFISDKIEVHHNGAIPKNIAVNMFKEWYNANNGNKHSSPKEVIAYIDKRFGKNRNGVWTGIRIRDDSSSGTNYMDDSELASDITDIDFSEV